MQEEEKERQHMQRERAAGKKNWEKERGEHSRREHCSDERQEKRLQQEEGKRQNEEEGKVLLGSALQQ